MKEKLYQLYRISRPHLWLYLFGPALLGSVMLVRQTGYEYIGWIIWFLIYFLIPANVFVYGVNDVADTDTDKWNVKKEGYEGRLDSEGASLLPWILGIQLPWLVSLIFLPFSAVLFFLLFLFLAFFYSTKPIRAKAIPFVDSWFNLLYIVPGFFVALINPVGTIAVWALFAGWAWCVAMHAYSAIPDIEADKRAGLATTATVLGKQGTILYCGLFWFIAAFLGEFSLSFVPSILFAAYFVMLVRTQYADTHKQLLNLYAEFPYLNGIVGMILFFTLALQ